ncbi:MAG TPA: hypothetical protein VL121_11900 [Agriterribacter sp.]|nr:hypothetical protein [Agriterribacter sp.]HTN07432.1 hypothetical protein [Agriterribacter sp.]
MEQYSKEIDEALTEVEAGNYITRTKWKNGQLNGKGSKMVSPATTPTGKSISLYFAGLLSKRRESDDGYFNLNPQACCSSGNVSARQIPE